MDYQKLRRVTLICSIYEPKHINDHFETRRYIADKILGDKKLADAYSALEKLHNDFGRLIGNDAITIRQRLETTLKAQLKKKVINWDNVWSSI